MSGSVPSSTARANTSSVNKLTRSPGGTASTPTFGNIPSPAFRPGGRGSKSLFAVLASSAAAATSPLLDETCGAHMSHTAAPPLSQRRRTIQVSHGSPTSSPAAQNLLLSSVPASPPGTSSSSSSSSQAAETAAVTKRAAEERKYVFFCGRQAPCFARVVKESHEGENSILLQPLRPSYRHPAHLIPWEGHLWSAKKDKTVEVKMITHANGELEPLPNEYVNSLLLSSARPASSSSSSLSPSLSYTQEDRFVYPPRAPSSRVSLTEGIAAVDDQCDCDVISLSSSEVTHEEEDPLLAALHTASQASTSSHNNGRFSLCPPQTIQRLHGSAALNHRSLPPSATSQQSLASARLLQRERERDTPPSLSSLRPQKTLTSTPVRVSLTQSLLASHHKPPHNATAFAMREPHKGTTTHNAQQTMLNVSQSMSPPRHTHTHTHLLSHTSSHTLAQIHSQTMAYTPTLTHPQERPLSHTLGVSPTDIDELRTILSSPPTQINIQAHIVHDNRHGVCDSVLTPAQLCSNSECNTEPQQRESLSTVLRAQTPTGCETLTFVTPTHSHCETQVVTLTPPTTEIHTRVETPPTHVQTISLTRTTHEQTLSHSDTRPVSDIGIAMSEEKQSRLVTNNLSREETQTIVSHSQTAAQTQEDMLTQLQKPMLKDGRVDPEIIHSLPHTSTHGEEEFETTNEEKERKKEPQTEKEEEEEEFLYFYEEDDDAAVIERWRAYCAEAQTQTQTTTQTLATEDDTHSTEIITDTKITTCSLTPEVLFIEETSSAMTGKGGNTESLDRCEETPSLSTRSRRAREAVPTRPPLHPHSANKKTTGERNTRKRRASEDALFSPSASSLSCSSDASTISEDTETEEEEGAKERRRARVAEGARSLTKSRDAAFGSWPSRKQSAASGDWTI